MQKLRLSRGMSLRALARSSGIHASTLSRWESGTTHPSSYELEAVLRALNASQGEAQTAWEQLNAPRALAHVKQSHSLPPMPMQGDLWRAMRMRKGWTLEQTASALGVTAVTLRRWERSESLPTIEDRIRLGHLLDATQTEIDWLCKTEGGVLPLLYPLPKTLGAIREVLEHRFWLSQPFTLFEDLFYLSVEAFLHRLLRRGQAAQSVLTTAYVVHARMLTNQGRLLEAQTPAYHALWWMERINPLEPHWLDVVHIIAKGNAELQSRFCPHLGMEFLRKWVPLAKVIAPEHEQWFLRDIAEYQSFTRERASAVSLSQDIMKNVRNSLERDMNPILTHALVLTNGGRPREAMELLESTPDIGWDDNQVHQQNINLCTVWIRTLRGVGREEEAHFWLLRAQELIQKHHIWQPRAALKLFK
ncbi:MAG: helix-turn-helix transcriptional regulator [Fimbriimonadales bacterium]